jgi:hypothetical protein
MWLLSKLGALSAANGLSCAALLRPEVTVCMFVCCQQYFGLTTGGVWPAELHCTGNGHTPDSGLQQPLMPPPSEGILSAVVSWRIAVVLVSIGDTEPVDCLHPSM